MRKLLESTGRFEVRVNEELTGAGPETFAGYDVLLLNHYGPRWGERTEKALLEFVAGGKGLVVYVPAAVAFRDWPEYDALVGANAQPDSILGKGDSPAVKIADTSHPITQGLTDFLRGEDEHCRRLSLHPETHILAMVSAPPDKEGKRMDVPIAYVHDYGKGRVFGLAFGRSPDAMDHGFVNLLARGTEWAATGRVTLAPLQTHATPPAIRVRLIGGAWSVTRADVLTIWPDGHIIWSKDPIQGGPPFFETNILAETVQSALADFEKRGIFEDPLLKWPHYGPDATHISIVITKGKKRLVLRSWDDFFDHRGESTNAKTRHFIQAWNYVRKTLKQLTPKFGKPTLSSY